jgi:predicted RecB family nuclease
MIVGNLPVSWNELILAFIQCDFKAHLKLQGKSGRMPDIEYQLRNKAKQHRRKALKKIVENHDPSHVIDSPPILLDALKSGPHIITNAIVIHEELPLHLDALILNKRTPLKSNKKSEIGLVVCVECETLSKEYKTWALGVNQVMSIAIAAAIPNVTVIHGCALRQTTIATDDRKHSAAKIITSLSKLRGGDEQPRLRLKGHCKACEFRRRCYLQALEADDLSLIQAMTEKEIKKLNAKGIVTTTQYSYTFRPRRQRKSREKTRPGKHNLALQALAKRTNTIYLADNPNVPSADTAVYVDIEGIPEQKLYYLIGLRIVTKSSTQIHSFWSDSKADEEALWVEFGRVLEPLKNFSIFHYGAYESRAFRALSKRYGADREVERWIEKACFNVLSAIYGHVHFPTLSNSLKDIASILGFAWTESEASGIQSLAWRYAWEECRSPKLKQKLITYNQDDCQALQIVTETLRDLSHADTKDAKLLSKSVATVESLETETRQYTTLIKKNAVFPELMRINDCSYYSYQRARVEIRTDPTVRRSVKREHRRIKKHRVNERVVLGRLLTCPNCGNKPIYKHGKLLHRKYDLKTNQSGIKRWVVETVASRYRCGRCKKAVSPEKYHATTRHKYGRTLMAWVVYKHVSHTQSYGSIVEELRDIFGYSIPRGSTNRFKHYVASRCRFSYEVIKKRIRRSSVIYADETSAKMKGSGGYVWVFATPNMVYYIYNKTREGDLLQEVLNGFNGVLVSDFYAAYDSIQCAQQKCLIHLVRDINDDVFKNPFDEELKSLAKGLTDVLCPIVETIDKFGLKKRNLRKHKKTADQYCATIKANDYTSEFAMSYQRRITKYADRMFTFLGYDGVSWNNNNAEHAIKRYAILRRCFAATSTAEGIGEYMVLLSICETLRRNGFNFLEFLQEKKLDINRFL